MDTTILVKEKIDEGAALVRNLDSNSFPVSAAFWFLDPEDRKWKLVMASATYDAQGQKNIYDSLQNYGVPAVNNAGGLALTDIAAVSPRHDLVRLMKTAISTAPTAVAGINFTGNTINNTYVEAAYIYRLA